MNRRLHDALTLSAERLPEKDAVVLRDKRMTYGEWDARSNRLAHALKATGCRAGDRVGLLLPKSFEALIGMFGALKADCIYVPLDTASPAARLVRILESADCRCLLAMKSAAPLLNELIRSEAFAATKVGWMDEGADLDAGLTAFSRRNVEWQPASRVDSPASDHQSVAHILFTSGTTGAPKGVMITHANVTQFIDWGVKRFGMGAGDRISAHPPFHFDLSTFDIHGSVAVGAELHLVPPELNLLPNRLADFIRNSQLTQWFSVPSILTHMAKSNAIQANDFPSLRRLLWCGEKFPTPALMHWMQRLPDVGFFNLYGPTEATIASSCYQVQACPTAETAEIPIGEACDGERLLVLGGDLRPVGPGNVGDLYIGGAGLSPGYWRDAARTDEVFRQDPALPGPDGRIYKTGDLARPGEDAQLYLLGRLDSQIKSRGYRIELGEIEAALHSLTEIRDAAVVAIESEAFEGTEICCAWVPVPGADTTPVKLRKRLTQLLPGYMIPARWMELERMPLNGNGKTDRRCLKEKFRQTAQRPDEEVPRHRRPVPPISFSPLEQLEARVALMGEAVL